MTNPTYSRSHEWIRLEDGGIATVGISRYAQEALGDVVFVELPSPGTVVVAKQEVAVIESVKVASDVYSPVSGEIMEVNESLAESPELVNSSPLEDGWLFRIRPSNPAEFDELLSEAAYAETCA